MYYILHQVYRFQITLKQHFTRLKKHLTVAMVAVGSDECEVSMDDDGMKEVEGLGKVFQWVFECVEKICKKRTSDDPMEVCVEGMCMCGCV